MWVFDSLKTLNVILRLSCNFLLNEKDVTVKILKYFMFKNNTHIVFMMYIKTYVITIILLIQTLKFVRMYVCIYV